jgi:hypothetical protein
LPRPHHLGVFCTVATPEKELAIDDVPFVRYVQFVIENDFCSSGEI